MSAEADPRTGVLLIDVGNTALKWTLSPPAAAVAGDVDVILHAGLPPFEARLRAAASRLPAATRAVGCSVAGAEVNAAVDAVLRERGIEVEWLQSQPRYAGRIVLVNGYRTPTQLGADRWHGLLGAASLLGLQSFVLIAAGTATTIDCVEVQDGSARFVGGCIAPGVRLMLDALARRTAGLPLADGAAVDFPDNTDDAIMTGVIDSQAGLSLRLVARFAQRIGAAPRVLVSGGDAEALAARLQAGGLAVTIAHNLVLAGLALRARSPGNADR
jgi:type III pantothenate kinase